MTVASDVDVVVIGGGLAGTAVLRELARHGVRALLFDQDDLCAAGSVLGAGSIDVGDLLPSATVDRARRLVRATEGEIVVRTAQHLAAFVPVLAVANAEHRGAAALARWDALLALRARDGQDAGALALDARAARDREPSLVVDDDRGVLLDRRVRFDAHRLALAYARDAIEHGAEVRLRHTVRTFSVPGAGVRVAVDDAYGARTEISARAIVVATGAWPAPGAPRAAAERTVQLVIDHAITTHAIVIDGESLVPFHGLTVVTGRATSFDGDGTNAPASRDEVRALVTSLGRHVPDLREARIVDTRACVRRASDAVPSAPPVFVVPRGTPWDARARGEAIATDVCRHLGVEPGEGTRDAKLPGGEEAIDAFDVAERMAMPEAAARRLTLRHGARCIDIGARVGRRRTEAAVVCACDAVLEAEVRHAVRAELAHDVADVCRRTQLGLASCGGMRCAHRAAEIVGQERALPPSEVRAMARRFLAERWRARAPGLDAASLAQEELARARWVGASGLMDAEPQGRDPEPRG